MFQFKNHVPRTLAQLRWLSLLAFGPEALDAKHPPSSRMLRETCPSPRCSSETCILLHKSPSYACLWSSTLRIPITRPAHSSGSPTWHLRKLGVLCAEGVLEVSSVRSTRAKTQTRCLSVPLGHGADGRTSLLL
ncbi:uncharacterized protein BDZ83DRAFT_648856 [Colletotrichum acutatum]|uniref:Secreted protein n=1 Tax=Glomerella acutata TaxID=27357 RepID=A0AAD8XI92_GLOAC|nr:uncharacterized protein BDZ83DRAFT_648856 [Colletotrichum acutatum]KAK1728292.1 hypothetical protein BDZ83DRAFT_648856 [Colletotrichum acutatum]